MDNRHESFSVNGKSIDSIGLTDLPKEFPKLLNRDDVSLDNLDTKLLTEKIQS